MLKLIQKQKKLVKNLIFKLQTNIMSIDKEHRGELDEKSASRTIKWRDKRKI